MNSWKNNNMLPTDKETFIDVKMNNLMNFLNAEDLSSNENIMNDVHFDESVNLKEATAYDPEAYDFAASQFHMSLDELEHVVNADFKKFNALVAQDKGIQKRYSGVVYSKKQWLQKINYLRENIEFYKPEKFGTQYIKGYRSITLNKYLDFNPDQPGLCWTFNKEYQQKNEKTFILQGTGNGGEYLLRLKAAFKNSDIDWVKTVYLLENDEGELRLHPDGKAYIFDKLIYHKGSNEKELDIAGVVGSERRDRIAYLRQIKSLYNSKTNRYDIKDISAVNMDFVYKNGRFLIPIGLWNGDLKIEGLISFENGPTNVAGNFDCSYSRSLTSLEGAPKYVGGNFCCNCCSSLTSLRGAPETVGRNFYCNKCSSLTSLEGAPEKVEEYFICWECDSLITLEGAPRTIGGSFNCSYCPNLASLIGAPEKVRGDFCCGNCNSLTSLEGAPEEVKGDFDCYYCKNLTSLNGAPRKVGGFGCLNCPNLTSLEGAPEYVEGIFNCSDCKNLKSLKGLPKKVEGDFDCSNCGKKFPEKGVRSVCDVHGEVYC